MQEGLLAPIPPNQVGSLSTYLVLTYCTDVEDIIELRITNTFHKQSLKGNRDGRV